jgi:heat shock protein HslJ
MMRIAMLSTQRIIVMQIKVLSPWAIMNAILAICLFMPQSMLIAGGPPSAETITGIEWQWIQSLYGNDTKAIPSDPSHYTIIFNPDGTVSVRADCNRAGGNYTAKSSRISVQVTHSTMAMCPPDSLDTQFLKDLDAAAIYFFKDGHLYLDLKYDSGTMQFKP